MGASGGAPNALLSRSQTDLPYGFWIQSAVRRPRCGVLALRNPQVRLIAVVTATAARTFSGREWFACLSRNARPAEVQRALESAFANIALTEKERRAREELVRAEREQEELNRIGVALSATHDVGALLQMILAKTREITGADAGSLYVLESESAANWCAGQVGAGTSAFSSPKMTAPISSLANIRCRLATIPSQAMRPCTAR